MDEGYEGIKFQVVPSPPAIPSSCRMAHAAFLASGRRLTTYDLTPGSSGNLSMKVPEGMIITSSGCDLGAIRLQDLVLVTGCDETQRLVHCSSGALPSSETFLHWGISANTHAIGAIVHVHGDLGLPKRLGIDLPETPREVPYGSQVLSRMAAQTASFGPKGSVIILKNHGFLALGANLFDAADLLVSFKVDSTH